MRSLFYWLNIDPQSFPPIQVGFLMVGFIFWILAYKEILAGTHRYKLVEIPMVVVALDIAWEFNWGFLLNNDLGPLFQGVCIVWFLLDVYINYNTLRFGKKLVTNDWIRENYVGIYFFVLTGGFLMTYFMRIVHEDDGLGLISAYLINMMISSLYVYQLVSFPHYRNQGFSYRVAWTKFLGTAFISVATFIHVPDNPFLHTMCILVFIMDVLYIYLFKNYQPNDRRQTVSALEQQADG